MTRATEQTAESIVTGVELSLQVIPTTDGERDRIRRLVSEKIRMIVIEREVQR